jgi:LmbE family N-acetylglucosaminyl deacetylase
MCTLIVVAHPDDEVLGCGATAAKLVTAGERVTCAVLCSNVENRAGKPEASALLADMHQAESILGLEPAILGSFPNLRLNTVAHIELVQFIERAMVQTQADTIYTHHPSDVNDDHRAVALACFAAARRHQRAADVPPLKALYMMEVLSSTDWAFPAPSEAFTPNAFVEIGEAGLAAKLKALAAYRGVMRPYPHSRSNEAIRAQVTLRGAQAGMHFAEAFQVAFIAQR